MTVLCIFLNFASCYMELLVSAVVSSQETWLNLLVTEKEQYLNYWTLICKQFHCYHGNNILSIKWEFWTFTKCIWSKQFWVPVSTLCASIALQSYSLSYWPFQSVLLTGSWILFWMCFSRKTILPSV